MHRQIIGGKRVCGKSTELIRMSHMLKIPIMAPCYRRARRLEETALEMRMPIPHVITPNYLEHHGLMKGKVLVDDIEDVFAALTGMSIRMASTSIEFKEMEEVKINV